MRYRGGKRKGGEEDREENDHSYYSNIMEHQSINGENESQHITGSSFQSDILSLTLSLWLNITITI